MTVPGTGDGGMTYQENDVTACRWCGTAIYLHYLSDKTIVAGTGIKGNEHWRHIAGNDRHCIRGNGSIAEPYDGTGPIAEQLRELLK